LDKTHPPLPITPFYLQGFPHDHPLFKLGTPAIDYHRDFKVKHEWDLAAGPADGGDGPNPTRRLVFVLKAEEGEEEEEEADDSYDELYHHHIEGDYTTTRRKNTTTENGRRHRRKWDRSLKP
jgi:hypothetical protein